MELFNQNNTTTKECLPQVAGSELKSWFLIVCFQDHHPSQQGQCGLHGIYLRAFCTGLDSVLQPYRQALLDLEQEVREEIWEHLFWDSRLGHVLEFEMFFDMVGYLRVGYFLCVWRVRCTLCDCPSHDQSGMQIMPKVPECVYKSPSFGFIIAWKSELIIFYKASVLNKLKLTLSPFLYSLLVFMDQIESRYFVWYPT